MPVKSGDRFSSRRSLPNFRSSARRRRRRAALPRRLQPCARSAAGRRAGSARCRPARHCPPHGAGNRADARSSHCRPGLLRSERAASGIARLADLPVVAELATLARRTASRCRGPVALPRPAEFPRLVTLAIAVAALARRRAAKIARRVATLVVAALHLPRRTLALGVEYVGLRPMAGRDHLVLLRPIPVLIVHIVAERPPQRARGAAFCWAKVCAAATILR